MKEKVIPRDSGWRGEGGRVVIEDVFTVQGMLVKMFLNLTRIFTWFY